jgi:phosphoserine phosphatase
MVSGGFRALAARAQRDLGVVHSFAACDYFFGEDGKLAGWNLLPCDFEGKLDFVSLMLREYGLAETDWVFVGDGANDVPVAEAAPLSVGYRPHAKLRAIVDHVIDDFSQLPRVLEENDDQ